MLGLDYNTFKWELKDISFLILKYVYNLLVNFVKDNDRTKISINLGERKSTVNERLELH